MTTPSPEHDDQNLDGRTILLVEDEVLIAMDLSDTFDSAGAEVAYARTLDEGLKLAEDGHFDAALLDVNLGRGETCAPIAETLARRGIPFALHSGDLDRRGELVSSIDAPLVRKPVSAEAVISAISALIRGKG